MFTRFSKNFGGKDNNKDLMFQIKIHIINNFALGFGAQVVSAEWARAQPPWPTCVSRSSDTPPYKGGES